MNKDFKAKRRARVARRRLQRETPRPTLCGSCIDTYDIQLDEPSKRVCLECGGKRSQRERAHDPMDLAVIRLRMSYTRDYMRRYWPNLDANILEWRVMNFVRTGELAHSAELLHELKDPDPYCEPYPFCILKLKF